MFLTNLIWNTRGERQCFQFGPRDNQDISWDIAKDPNAQISVISGAWAVPLFQSNRNFAESADRGGAAAEDRGRTPRRAALALCQGAGADLDDGGVHRSPMEPLQTIIDEIGAQGLRRLTEAPRMVDLTASASSCRTSRTRGCTRI